MFILENVKGLVTLENGRYLKSILAELKSIGQKATSAKKSAYEIHHQVLNTKDHGVPQNRPRWFCVGILRGTLKDDDESVFQFPGNLREVSIGRLLETRGDLRTDEPPMATKNIEHAKKTIGPKFNKKTYIVDCDAASNRSNWL